MFQPFQNWCRLCAKTEGCTKDVLVQDDTAPDLRLTIESHFAIQVLPGDIAPTTICDDCHEYLLKLIEFEGIVFHAQAAFDCDTLIEEIDESSCDIKVDISSFFEGIEESIKISPPEEPTKLKYACKRCDKSYRTENALHAHMKAHAYAARPKPKLTCDVCGVNFSKSFSLRSHRKLVHSDDRPFICDECGRGFKRCGDLTRHKEFHRDDFPFGCNICDKKFKSKLVATMHEKNHSAERYKCNICGQQLKTKHTLRGHLLTHTNDMKFTCRYCGKKFRYKKNLNCHLLTHTGVQPFRCAFCKQAFSLRWNCRTHQKKMHPRELAEYEKEGKSTLITSQVKQEFACGRRHPKESSEA